MSVDAERLAAEIETLSRFSDDPWPAVTRVLFTPPDIEARAWFLARCEEAGLEMRFNAIGNLFARWVGTEPDLAAVATGSHNDALPMAGRFDGVVGVLGGLEAIRSLQRQGVRPRRSIELIMFTAEEPTRFGIGCIGSRLMSGALTPERVEALLDDEGLALSEASVRAGYSGAVDQVRLDDGRYAAFVELHIEQGPLLERRGVPIGVVEAIAAPATLRVEFSGSGGHAGALLMGDRHDPIVAAAQVILATNRAARATGAIDTVATCGLMHVSPGAVNSVPRHVRLEIDVRDTDLARRDATLASIRSAATQAAKDTGVELNTVVLNADPPATCDPQVIAAITATCDELGLPFDRMVSRAYHDTTFMATISPSAMIFIPCRDGVSHRPDEYASPADIARGVQVLAGTLARLAR